MRFFFLVTGTREATLDGAVDVWRVLDEALSVAETECSPRDMALIHGDCPNPYLKDYRESVDQIADKWAVTNGVQIIAMPYNAKYGRSGGPMRNKEMVFVAQGLATCGIPHMCLAFPQGESKGTRGCIELIHKAGLNLRVHEI